MARRLNINTALVEDLATLPGIGNVLAARIVSYRGAHGPFKGKKELLSVSGFTDRLLSPIIDKISLTTGASRGQKSDPELIVQTSPSSTDRKQPAAPKSATTAPPVADKKAVKSDTSAADGESKKKKKSQAILSDKQIRKLAKRIKLSHEVMATLFTVFQKK